MRYDKAGNYDGAMGYERRAMGYEAGQAEYDRHYANAVNLLAQGATSRQILWFDPDLTRPFSEYLSRG